MHNVQSQPPNPPIVYVWKAGCSTMAFASNFSNICYIRHTKIMTPACKIVSFETLLGQHEQHGPDSRLQASSPTFLGHPPRPLVTISFAARLCAFKALAFSSP